MSIILTLCKYTLQINIMLFQLINVKLTLFYFFNMTLQFEVGIKKDNSWDTFKNVVGKKQNLRKGDNFYIKISIA